MDFNQIYSKIVELASSAEEAAFDGQPTEYELIVEGEDGGVITAIVGGGKVELSPHAAQNAVCSAAIDKPTLEKVLNGEKGMFYLLASGKLKLKGDTSGLMRLASALKQSRRNK